MILIIEYQSSSVSLRSTASPPLGEAERLRIILIIKTSTLYHHSAVASCQLRSAAAATLLALRAISPIRGIYPASWGKQDYIIKQNRN